MSVGAYADRLRKIELATVGKAVLIMWGSFGLMLSAAVLYTSFQLVVYEILTDAGVFEGAASFETATMVRIAFEVPAVAVIGASIAKIAELVSDESVAGLRWAAYAVGAYMLAWGAWLNVTSLPSIGGVGI